MLSLFPGSFERRAAAELLGMTSIALSKTRSLLRILTTCNLLQYSSTSERYIMHASVRACCRSLARELGLTYESARYGLRPALAILQFNAHMFLLVVSRLPTLTEFDCPPETCAGKCPTLHSNEGQM